MRLAPLALFALAFGCRYPNADLHFGLVVDDDEDGFNADEDCDDHDAEIGDSITFHTDGDGDGVGVDEGATAEGCTPPDGFASEVGDCDDADDGRFPGNDEVVGDDIDQDCNTFDTVSCFADVDKDGWGASTTVLADDGTCDTSEGEAENADDCADNDASRHPGATEIPGDTIDQNCDGADTPPCYHDDDTDDFGDPLAPIVTNDCAGQGGVTTGTDCDDDDDTVYVGASELCDGQVNSCGGSLPSLETDPDGDHYVGCTVDPGGWDGTPGILGGDDCATSDAVIFPGAPALCDGKINACNTTLPANEIDDDNDTFVECTFATGVTSGNWGNVESPAVTAGGDCNDAAITIFPSAPEICDGKINTCGGSLPLDEVDNDDDRFVECTFASGVTSGNWGNVENPTVIDDGDCNDASAFAKPGATEYCDGIDNDCDSSITDENGLISVSTLDGSVWQNAPSSATARQTLNISSNGRAWVCNGTHYVRFNIASSALDVTITGLNGRDSAILSGADPSGGSPVPTDRIVSITDTGNTSVRVVTLDDLTFEDGKRIATNTADGGGGAIWIDGAPDVAVTDCDFDTNTAWLGGAIFMNDGTLDVTGSTFTGNDADVDTSSGGGAIAVLGGIVTIGTSTFTSNNAYGGGAFDLEGGSATTITGSTFTSNTGELGGAFYVTETSDLTIGTSTMSLNTATTRGGAIRALDNSDVILNAGTVINNNTCSGAQPTGGGGGIAFRDGTLTLHDADITGNHATAGYGGGIFADADGGQAITILMDSVSTVAGNNALTAGGGIAVLSAATTVTANNAFVTGNTSAQGAGVFLGSSGGAFTCTAISANSAGVFDNDASASTTGGDVGVGGGAQLNVSGATLASTLCDWGTSTLNNTPSDIGFDGGTKTNAGASATFTCTFAGCL